MIGYDSTVCRSGTGNMKGEIAHKLPDGGILLLGAEMDYPTAPCIRKALAAFAENGIYGYTISTDMYTSAIVNWISCMRGASACPEWIVPTMGTVFAFSTAVRAFTEVGDGVIVQSPSYYRLNRAAERNGRQLVTSPLREDRGIYRLDLADLEKKMSCPHNTLMVLSNPHNPTGRVFTEEELGHIAELAQRHNVIVFCDEIFAETTQPGYTFRPYACLFQRGITSFSLGKAFNFTGVSQANLLIPDEGLRQRYLQQREQDHYGSIDPFFYTALLAAYSEEGAAWIRDMNAHTAHNHALIRQAIETYMPRLFLSPLEGTFVAWLDCRALGLDDEELQRFFEEEARIFADPGIEYGSSGFYRWNLATPSLTIRRALEQLKTAYDRHF